MSLFGQRGNSGCLVQNNFDYKSQIAQLKLFWKNYQRSFFIIQSSNHRASDMTFCEKLPDWMIGRQRIEYDWLYTCEDSSKCYNRIHN